MILRAEQHRPPPPGVDLAFSTAVWMAAQRGEHPPSRPSRTSTAEHARTVAYVNHGRWVADCPFCNGAQIVSPEDPRYFCDECHNSAVKGMYAPVVFPGPKQVAEIETALDERPVVDNRNWLPGETVRQLRDENKANLPALHADAPPPYVARHGRRRLNP